jgi:catechol-2,3-dioxygenase
VKDAVSHARIQANNAYYKDVLGLEMNKKLGSSAIYLTEEQYN